MASLAAGVAHHEPVLAVSALPAEGKIMAHRFVADVRQQTRQLVPLLSAFHPHAQALVKADVFPQQLRLTGQWIDHQLFEVNNQDFLYGIGCTGYLVMTVLLVIVVCTPSISTKILSL